MATVNWWHHEYVSGSGYLAPQQVKQFWYGPQSWYGHAVAASAHPLLVKPNDAATMEVTRVESYWDRKDGPHWLVVTVKNLGPAHANVEVVLGVITP